MPPEGAMGSGALESRTHKQDDREDEADDHCHLEIRLGCTWQPAGTRSVAGVVWQA